MDSFSLPQRSDLVVGLGGVVAGGTIAAMHVRGLIALAKLTARGDHPVCEIEHGPFEQAGAVVPGLGGQDLQADLFSLFQNALTIIFSHVLGMPVVHSYSFCKAITNDRLKRHGLP